MKPSRGKTREAEGQGDGKECDGPSADSGTVTGQKGRQVARQDKRGRSTTERAIGIIARLLIVTGGILIGVYILASVHSVVMSRIALHEFKEAEQKKSAPSKSSGAQQRPKKSIDFSLWATKRIEAYKKALAKQFAPPEAVLEIPRIGLEVPVFEGTDDLTLNRGVGRIAGTARVGQDGNFGIAGHRDGFFRGLKDVEVGDTIKLKTPSEEETYRVEKIQIVKPDDVNVLKDRGVPMLTLVTCYPFYFVGHAPKRYVVQASLSAESVSGKSGVEGNSTARKTRNQEETR